jgi:hypothetical protein
MQRKLREYLGEDMKDEEEPEEEEGEEDRR